MLIRLSAACLLTWLAAAADPVIALPGASTLRAGKSSFIALTQARLNQLAEGCRPTPLLAVSGQFEASLRRAIQKAARCVDFNSLLPADSAARNGALTEKLWNALFPGRPSPTAHERAMVIVLTQEATDYDALEWNFCQSRPAYDPGRGQPVCFSNDPRSFLTWGPRGATAGHGAEVQQIVHAIDSDPATRPAVDAAFGTLAPDVRRFVRLDAADTERFLCAVWLDAAGRQGWKDGFRRFGSSDAVRHAYDAVYGSSAYDGQKIERYYRLYRAAGVVPTEVDYGFMLDRATQMSAPSAATVSAAAKAMQAPGAQRTPPQLRRWLALNFRPGGLRADRLGRDVVFYVDALEGSLTPEELTAWKNRNALRASDVGLRDAVAMAEFTAPALAFPRPPRGTATLSAAERERCPPAVLNPQAP